MSVSTSKLIQSEKYIIFGIAEDLYGLEVENLKEVFQTEKILKLPRTSDILAGIVNLRGVIISVFDLSILLWGKESQISSQSLGSDQIRNVLLITIKNQDVGILVDQIYHLGEIQKFEKKSKANLQKRGFLNDSIIKKIGILDDKKNVFILDLEGLLTSHVSAPKTPKISPQDDDVLDFDLNQYTLPDPEDSSPEKNLNDIDLEMDMLKLPVDDQEDPDVFNIEEDHKEKPKAKPKAKPKTKPKAKPKAKKKKV